MHTIQRLSWTDVWLADSVARAAGVSVHTANSLLHGRMKGCTPEKAEAVLAAMWAAYSSPVKPKETRRVLLPRRKA